MENIDLNTSREVNAPKRPKPAIIRIITSARRTEVKSRHSHLKMLSKGWMTAQIHRNREKPFKA
jgi:hypothetical protein